MQLDPPCDIVVVARRQAADLQYAESVQQFTSVLRRYLRKQRSQRRDKPLPPAAPPPATVQRVPESP
jgi:RNase P protein component